MPASLLERDKPVAYRGQFLLRLLGALLLTASAVMVVLGSTVLSPRLAGLRYVTYWSWCFLITIVALLAALVDLLLVRRAGQKTRRQLVAEQFLSDDFVQKLRSNKDRKS